MKNVLFSTTRQWNPGDEFIMLGIRNLFKDLGMSINPVIHNRNPEVRAARYLRRDFVSRLKNSNYSPGKIVKKISPKINTLLSECKKLIEFSDSTDFTDNSFKPSYLDKHIFEYIVFAGSPEWYNHNNDELFDYIERHNPVVLFLGVGAAESFKIDQLSPKRHKAFECAKLIMTRDKYSTEELSFYGAIQMSCPALFASSYEVEYNGISKIGLGYTDYRSVECNRLNSKETYDNMCQIYDKIIDRYGSRVEIVCHYIDELYTAKERYPGVKCHYSCDAKDYIDIYSQFSLVVTPRVHGLGLCSSLGIPSIYIPHDMRSDTVNGFLPFMAVMNANDISWDLISEASLNEHHKKLIGYKKIMKQKTIELLQDALASTNNVGFMGENFTVPIPEQEFISR